jgi:hypothetical protein
MPIHQKVNISFGLCNKCKRKISVYKLGHHDNYELCQKCMEAWTLFRNTTLYVQQMDDVYDTPKFTSVWLKIFHAFLGGRYVEPEKVQFT